MDIIKILQKEFKIEKNYIENIINLIDDGNTIPFIARYRKELTGSMDDQLLRSLYDRLVYLRNFEDKRNFIRETIESQGNLTQDITEALQKARSIAELEDIYRPFRPKRRTRATVAKEKGLEPLALIIFNQDIDKNINEICSNYVDDQKGIKNEKEALNGAKDIVSEMLSDDLKIRRMVRRFTMHTGFLTAKASKENVSSIYDMYYGFTEQLRQVANHRVLAVNRGEKEGFLTVKIIVEENIILDKIYNYFSKKNEYIDDIIKEIIDDSYKRLIAPSIEREIRSTLTEKAQENSIKIFNENLRQLLLQPPIKGKTILALDPGFRTGCKFAVLDEIGRVLDVGVIYPVSPHNKFEESKEIILTLIEKHNVDIVAIGNGTASRETEQFVANTIKGLDKKVYYIIVNEAGASVYSASKLGADEFPDFDVSLRSAISIGRRLQDPLAELVKIDPKSIGVGQYQHDMNQKKLGESLGGVVESCVNNVGVDLNTASPSLLSYVSGITNSIAKNIIEYRNNNGKFKSREELLKVNKLGSKTYEQCAGFLRISEDDAENILDSTGVHPESYNIAEKILEKAGYSLKDINNKSLKNLSSKIENYEDLSKDLYVGVLTLKDIVSELEKSGRDPREDMPPQVLREDILYMEDLKEGMVLKGTVRNIIDFGAFVDIGVHQDGLVHISRICEKYIKHPLDAINVGDIVDVKVLSLDYNKKRIYLTMKDIS